MLEYNSKNLFLYSLWSDLEVIIRGGASALMYVCIGL